MHGLTGVAARRTAGRPARRSPAWIIVLALILIPALSWAVPAAASGGSGCSPFVSGTVIPIPCTSGAGTTGSPGTGGSGSSATSTCATIVFSPAQVQQLGLGPAPAGQTWAELACGAALPGVVFIPVAAAGGAPQVTPQQLMIEAYGELRVPSLPPATAPPLGQDGLVGLPEWFWVQAAGWRPLSVTVSAGPVWAKVTATPVSLTFDPGAGISPVSCQGPGTAYNPGQPSARQHTDCSYTYLQPSAGLPGDVYQASVGITWRVVWTGSGGAGGVLAPALSVATGLTIPVAQGEALVTAP